MNKKLIFSAILLSGLIFSGCSSKDESISKNKKVNMAKLVKIQPVVSRTLIDRLSLPGTIKSENVANILSTAEGKISKLLVREGDRVQINGVVAMISPLLREDIINSARLLLRAKKIALGKNPDDSKLQKELQQAEQDYRFALQQYREVPVISPISGIVSKRWVDPGDMITARSSLLEIQNNSRLRVDMPVSELDIRKLKMDQSVEIQADACPGKKFKGFIQRIYPQVDEQTRNVLVEIRLADPCPNLKAGMFVRVIFITQFLKDVLAVPVQAIIDRPKYKTCFIIKNGKAEERILKTGLEADGWVQVVSGISTGDLVVIEGQQQLKNGTAVKIQKQNKTRSTAESENK